MMDKETLLELFFVVTSQAMNFNHTNIVIDDSHFLFYEVRDKILRSAPTMVSFAMVPNSAFTSEADRSIRELILSAMFVAKNGDRY